jgi:hypothetical protein
MSSQTGLDTKTYWLTDRQSQCNFDFDLKIVHPCEGGFEFLHRNPENRRRRRNRKYKIWESKILSRVPRDSDPRKTTLARTSRIYKRQTRPLVREGTPEKQDRNFQRVINIHQDLVIDWSSVAMWLWQKQSVWRESRFREDLSPEAEE